MTRNETALDLEQQRRVEAIEVARINLGGRATVDAMKELAEWILDGPDGVDARLAKWEQDHAGASIADSLIVEEPF